MPFGDRAAPDLRVVAAVTKRPFVWAMALVIPMAGCTHKATPRGMTDAPVAPVEALDVPGGAAAAQTGAPELWVPGGADGGGEVPKASSTASADVKQAQEVWAQRCVLCHGPQGLGNGVAAENLKPKPRNLQDTAWQSQITDHAIATIVVAGGAAVGQSMMMPPNPDLAAKPHVVAGLVAIVRGLHK